MTGARSSVISVRGCQRTRASLTLVAVLALGSLIGLTATAEAARSARTIVTIRAQGTDLSGTVASRSRARCANNRQVTVYRQLGGRQNPRADEEIASDGASRQGRRYVWSTGNTGQTGRLYARAARIRGCLADTSPTINVVQPNGVQP